MYGRMLHDLPPLPPIRKPESGGNPVNPESGNCPVPGQMESAEDELNMPRPKTTERRTNIGSSYRKSIELDENRDDKNRAKFMLCCGQSGSTSDTEDTILDEGDDDVVEQENITDDHGGGDAKDNNSLSSAQNIKEEGS